jgi:hypothetical protein
MPIRDPILVLITCGFIVVSCAFSDSDPRCRVWTLEDGCSKNPDFVGHLCPHAVSVTVRSLQIQLNINAFVSFSVEF